MSPTEPPTLEYERPRRQRFARPFYCRYGVAYILIPIGFLIADKAGVPPGQPALEVIGATLFTVGLSIFVLAISWSIYFVLTGKATQHEEK